MRHLPAGILAACLGAAAHAPAAAQATPHHHPDAAHERAVAEFVAAVRSATQRYHDRAAAIADGFRLLGPDFPAMGEHWVQPGRMVEGRLEVSRPQALSYVIIDGRPVLTGVIFAKPLRPGDRLPDFPQPGFPWHDHAGAIDEESVLLHHVPSAADSGSELRLTMLHAWVWSNNPDGMFSADNWALPFMRLGLDPPEHTVPDAARMLSLLSGGTRYYTLLFRALARPTAAEEEAAILMLRGAQTELESWFSDRPEDRTFDQTTLGWLARRWQLLWSEMAAALRPEAAARLRPILMP